MPDLSRLSRLAHDLASERQSGRQDGLLNFSLHALTNGTRRYVGELMTESVFHSEVAFVFFAMANRGSSYGSMFPSTRPMQAAYGLAGDAGRGRSPSRL